MQELNKSQFLLFLSFSGSLFRSFRAGNEIADEHEQKKYGDDSLDIEINCLDCTKLCSKLSFYLVFSFLFFIYHFNLSIFLKFRYKLRLWSIEIVYTFSITIFLLVCYAVSGILVINFLHKSAISAVDDRSWKTNTNLVLPIFNVC